MNAEARHIKDETVILERIRSNDENALRLLYQLHYTMVLNMVLRNSGSHEDARDVYQEAMIALYQQVKHKSLVLRCKLRTYIYAIARRLWLNRLREKARMTTSFTDIESVIDLQPEDESFIESHEQRYRYMNECLEKLGEPCATILKDYYTRKMSMQVIAEKMGYTNADNAKNQKYKCLMRLKKLFYRKRTGGQNI